MKIAVDAMGGDYAPEQIVLGALRAAREYDCEIFLVGEEKKVQEVLERSKDWKSLRITVVNATEVIGMDEHPADAVRRKKNSSVVYITDYGRQYHSDLNCRKLKRTVNKVLYDEVKDRMPACSKCCGE